jgi:hypothetical protein
MTLITAFAGPIGIENIVWCFWLGQLVENVDGVYLYFCWALKWVRHWNWWITSLTVRFLRIERSPDIDNSCKFEKPTKALE